MSRFRALSLTYYTGIYYYPAILTYLITTLSRPFTDRSGWSRASAGLVLQRLYDLSVLFSGGSAPAGVVCILLQPIRTVPGTLWCGLWCNDVLRNISYLLGACPDYVIFILYLLFVTVSHHLVSSILRCHVNSSWLLSNVFWAFQMCCFSLVYSV